MVYKLNEKVTLEFRSGFSGFSVDAYSWEADGMRSCKQLYWSEDQEMAGVFFAGIIAGAALMEV